MKKYFIYVYKSNGQLEQLVDKHFPSNVKGYRTRNGVFGAIRTYYNNCEFNPPITFDDFRNQYFVIKEETVK